MRNRISPSEVVDAFEVVAAMASQLPEANVKVEGSHVLISILGKHGIETTIEFVGEPGSTSFLDMELSA